MCTMFNVCVLYCNTSNSLDIIRLHCSMCIMSNGKIRYVPEYKICDSNKKRPHMLDSKDCFAIATFDLTLSTVISSSPSTDSKTSRDSSNIALASR